MYYIATSGNKVVDAGDSLIYVRWQEKNSLWLTCSEEDAEGIVSYDGADIFLLEGSEPREGFLIAAVTEVTEEEYLSVREELDAGAEIAAPNVPDPGPETPAKTRLKQLEDQVAALQEVNDMLTECLLEMSEIVYGGE